MKQILSRRNVIILVVIGVIAIILVILKLNAVIQISPQEAAAKVKSRPEVQDYLKRVPNGIVEIDNELDGEYNVHVYEIKDRHTATFNWYRVSIKSGEIRPEFEIHDLVN